MTETSAVTMAKTATISLYCEEEIPAAAIGLLSSYEEVNIHSLFAEPATVDVKDAAAIVLQGEISGAAALLHDILALPGRGVTYLVITPDAQKLDRESCRANFDGIEALDVTTVGDSVVVEVTAEPGAFSTGDLVWLLCRLAPPESLTNEFEQKGDYQGIRSGDEPIQETLTESPPVLSGSPKSSEPPKDLSKQIAARRAPKKGRRLAASNQKRVGLIGLGALLVFTAVGVSFSRDPLLSALTALGVLLAGVALYVLLRVRGLLLEMNSGLRRVEKDAARMERRVQRLTKTSAKTANAQKASIERLTEEAARNRSLLVSVQAQLRTAHAVQGILVETVNVRLPSTNRSADGSA